MSSMSSGLMDLGLVAAVDRLGASNVIAVTDAAAGGRDARLRKALGVADAHLLRAAVAMTHRTAAMKRGGSRRRIPTTMAGKAAGWNQH